MQEILLSFPSAFQPSGLRHDAADGHPLRRHIGLQEPGDILRGDGVEHLRKFKGIIAVEVPLRQGHGDILKGVQPPEVGAEGCFADALEVILVHALRRDAGGQLGLPVYEEGQGDPVKIAENALRHARDYGNDLVFLDTAGRLHVDEALMDELKRMKSTVHPNEILLVVDAMTGQDAVNAASAFDEALGIDGVVLTKLDGDARGGAALSIKASTGKPIKFVGTGEKLDMIEPFHPDRMASRILGMGDMLSFIEKAQQNYDEKQAKKLEEKLKKNSFTLTDYFDQIQQLKNMGDLSQLAGMMPGNLGSKLQGAQIDEKALTRTEAIILSMTPAERENPQILGASRKKRIAAGCGLDVVDVNRLLKQFEGMQQIIKQVTGGRKSGIGGFMHGRGLRKRKKK